MTIEQVEVLLRKRMDEVALEVIRLYYRINTHIPIKKGGKESLFTLGSKHDYERGRLAAFSEVSSELRESLDLKPWDLFWISANALSKAVDIVEKEGIPVKKFLNEDLEEQRKLARWERERRARQVR